MPARLKRGSTQVKLVNESKDEPSDSSMAQDASSYRPGSLQQSDSMVPHRTFSWALVPPGEQALDISDMSVVQDHGVPKECIFRYVQKEIKQEAAFMALPFALLFVVVFMVCCLNHDHAGAVGDLEDAISTDLAENAVFAYTDPGWMGHKTLLDVHAVADVFSWLRVGLAPLLFKKFQIWSELSSTAPFWPEKLVPQDQKPMYLQHNRLIGGMELTQLRGEEDVCPNQQVTDVLKMSCVSVQGIDLNLQLEPEPFDIKEASLPVDPKFRNLFLMGEDPHEVGMRLRQMELSNWIDNSTTIVSANFITYNAHFDAMTLSSAMFFFSRSGKIWKQLLHSTFVLDQYKHWLDIFWDSLFCFMGFTVFLEECREIFKLCKRFRKSHEPGFRSNLIREHFNFWNGVDYLSLIAGVTLVVLWISHYQQLVALKEELISISSAEKQVESIFDEYTFEIQVWKFYTSFRQTWHFYNRLRIFGSLFTLVLVARLFKSFNAQPRLAVLVRTMSRAANDLFHFGLVFFATLLSFTMIANALFARDIIKFRTFGRSFASCFEILLGEFDLSELQQAGRALATFWFISFQVCMALVMLNMLLAIVFDIYSEVKGETKELESIQTQVSKLWTRWRENQQGQRVSWQTISYHLLSHRNSDNPDSSAGFYQSWTSPGLTITYRTSSKFMVNDFMDVVPGLEKKQALNLMLRTVRDFRQRHEQPMQLADAMRAINKISNDLDEIEEDNAKVLSLQSGPFSPHSQSGLLTVMTQDGGKDEADMSKLQIAPDLTGVTKSSMSGEDQDKNQLQISRETKVACSGGVPGGHHTGQFGKVHRQADVVKLLEDIIKRLDSKEESQRDDRMRCAPAPGQIPEQEKEQHDSSTRQILKDISKRLEILERKQNDDRPQQQQSEQSSESTNRLLQEMAARIEMHSKILLCATGAMSDKLPPSSPRFRRVVVEETYNNNNNTDRPTLPPDTSRARQIRPVEDEFVGDEKCGDDIEKNFLV